MTSRPPGRSRLVGLLGEAAANNLARPALSLGLVAILTVVLVAVAVGETNSTIDALTYRHGLVADGYSTLIVEPNDELGAVLRTDDCQALGSIQGVIAALSLGNPEPDRVFNPAGPQLSIRPVGGDILAFLNAVDPDQMTNWHRAQTFLDTNSSMASPGATREFDLPIIDTEASTTQATTLIVGLTALGGAASGNAIAVDPDPDPVNSCAILVDEDSRAHTTASVSVALPAQEGFSNRWALAGADRFETPRNRFESRATQYLWLAGALTFALTWLLTLRIRRSDYALYAVTGLKPGAIATLAGLEMLLITLTAALTATAILALGLLLTDVNSTIATRVGYTSAARAFVATVALCATACWYTSQRTTTSTIDAIKDR